MNKLSEKIDVVLMFAFLMLLNIMYPAISLGQVNVVSSKLLIQTGESLQLRVTKVSSKGGEVDITRGDSGTSYLTMDPNFTVDRDGLVTGVDPGKGTVLVTHSNSEDGKTALLFSEISIQVGSSGDSDGDGMPNEFEKENRLDPLNPADASQDLDGDEIPNKAEFGFGTDPQDKDTDDDGVFDGTEISEGTDPLAPNPSGLTRLSEKCIATVLNRSAQVDSDSGFVVPNVPVEPGLFRARIICLNNETTTKGYSEFTTLVTPFTPIENITFGALDPLPTALRISAPQQPINTPGQSAQFNAFATLPDRTEKDVTPQSTGTLWMSSNSTIASVSADGLVTAHKRGRALIQARNEGLIAAFQLEVLIPNDSDGDGMTDAFESTYGLNPNDPSDATTDADSDGLSNLEEFQKGTNPRLKDSDGDGLSDKQEITRGTNPTIADTDGDGLLDGAEDRFDTNPTNPDSDNDGISDGNEVALGLDPLAATATTTVTGRVTDQNGAALAGAAAVAFDRFTAITDNSGNFTITYVPATLGNITVFARAVQNGQALDGFSTPTAPVTNGTTNVGTIALQSVAGRVSGTVFSTTGQPVPGARVVVVSAADERIVITGTNGIFQVEQMPPGKVFVVATDPRSRLRGQAQGTLVTGQSLALNVSLTATGTLFGTVFQRDAITPVGAGVTIALSGPIELDLQTDAAGQYRVDFVPLGGYSIGAEDLTGNRGLTTVNLSSSNQTIQADVTFLGKGTVTGTVKTAAGVLVPGASVTLTSKSVFGGTLSVTTDANGVFRIPEVFVGNFTLAAQDPLSGLGGTAGDSIDADGQEVTVPMTLVPAGTITGTVFEANGVTPAAGVIVGAGGRSATANESGVYRLPFLPLSFYTLDAAKPNTDDRGRSSAGLNQEGQEVTANIILSGLGTVRVTVVDGSGAPVPGVQVRFNTGSPLNDIYCSLCRTGSTGVEGIVTFADVIAAPFSLAASDPIGMRGGGASSSVQPGQTVDVTIPLEAAGDIFGTVFAPDGRTPAPNITVRLTPLNRAVTTSVDGKFRFELVPIRLSPFRIDAFDASGAIRATEENIVVPAQDAEVQRNLILSGRGIAFGTVRTPTGALATGANVVISSQAPGGASYQATTNEFGEYLVRNVAQGPFSVFASIRPLRQGGTASGTVQFDNDEARADVQLLDNQVPPDTRTITTLFDANNFRFEVQNLGSIQDGQQQVYQGNNGVDRGGLRLDLLQGNVLTPFVGGTESFEENNREVVITGSGPAGLKVTRKVYIPQDGYFARYLEILENPGTTPVTVDVRVDSHFRIVSRIIERIIYPKPVVLVSTSSGDDLLTTADRWVTLDDDLDEDPLVNTQTTPALAFVYAGANASLPIGVARYEFPEALGFSRVRTQWTNVTVPPGQTRIILHFAVQDFSRSAAQAAAERLVQLPPEVRVGLSDGERTSIVNFTVPSSSPLPALPLLDGVISGLVREGDAVTPISGATVRLQSTNELFSRSFTLTTNANGRYELRSNLTTGGSFVPVPRGAFTVQATHPLTARTSATLTGNFPANSNIATQDITFTELGLLGGTVKRPNDAVVSGARVEISGTPLLNTIRTATSADGTYFVTGLPPGDYTVAATLENANGTGLAGAKAGVVNAGAKSTIDVVIDPAGGVEGTVLTGAGAPAVNVQVNLEGSGFSRGTRTDTGGRYKIFDSRVGTLTLRAVEPKTGIPTVTEVTIVEGQITQKDLQLIGFGTVDVFATFTDNTPAVGAPVQISETARGGSFRAVGSTNAQGRITIQDVTVGDFTLRVTHPTNATRFVDVPSMILNDGDVATLLAKVLLDTAPTVTLTKPTTGSTFASGASIVMEATAEDDLGISRVEFKINGSTVATDTTAPYSVTVTLPIAVPGTTLRLTAEAVDTSEQRTVSTLVPVIIIADQPPTITLTQAPADGAQVVEGSVVTFAATATDDVGVERVELRVNGATVLSDTTEPYQFQWVVPAASSVTNPVSIVLTAIDTLGQTKSTTVIKLTVIAQSGQCTPVPDGAVSWWRAEGNAEDAISANDGTLQNGTTFAPGKVSQALSFDGVDDVVSIPHSTDISFGPTSPLTVETWVYRTSTNPTQHILGKRVGCGSINYQLAFDNGGLVFNSEAGGVSTGTQLPLNTWTHLAATFDSTTFRFYMNGVQIATGTGTLGPTNTATLEIGGSGTCSTFGGLIDEVSIYNAALSASEIQALFNASNAGKCTNETCTSLPSGAVSWWPGDSNTNDLVDGNNGTLQNGATYAAGKVGQAFSFDGVDDYVRIPDAANLKMTNAVTIEAWIFPIDPGSPPTTGWGIVSKDGKYQIWRLANGMLGWAFANTNPGWVTTSTGYVAPFNQWTHVMVVYDAGVVRTYANGSLVHTFNGSGSIGDAVPQLTDLVIGAADCPPCRHFRGLIDEVTIYNRALSTAEIQTIFNAGNTGKCTNQNCAPLPSGAVSWWSGDGNTQDLVSGNNGTLQNGATFAPGKIGQAFSLDGQDDHIVVANNPELNLGVGEQLTIEAWVKPEDTNGSHTIISNWNGADGNCGGASVGYELTVGDGRFYLTLANNNVGNNYNQIMSGPLTANTWYYVVAQFSSTSNASTKLYVNGIEEASGSVAIPTDFSTTRPVHIGGHFNLCSGVVNRFKGQIDEISVYNRLLAASEIQTIFNAGSAGKCKEPFTVDTDNDGLTDGQETLLGTNPSKADSDNDGLSDGAEVKQHLTDPLKADTDSDGFTDGVEVNAGSDPLDSSDVPPITSCAAPPSGLVSWWKAEGNPEDNISANDGTLQNGAAFAPGKVGQAFSFDGQDDVVRVAHNDNLSFGLGAFSIEAWIQAPSSVVDPSGFRVIAGKTAFAFPVPAYFLRIANDNRVEFGVHDCTTTSCGFSLPGNGGTSQPVRSTSVVADNNFHHVVGVRRAEPPNQVLEIYVDGVLENTRVESLRNADNTRSLGIGAFIYPSESLTDQHFNGLIDEVSLYNRALSAAEVEAIFDAGSAGKCKRYVALNFNSLPSAQGWTYKGGTSEANVASINAGVLTFNTLGVVEIFLTMSSPVALIRRSRLRCLCVCE